MHDADKAEIFANRFCYSIYDPAPWYKSSLTPLGQDHAFKFPGII
jgi:hypothetical protein